MKRKKTTSPAPKLPSLRFHPGKGLYRVTLSGCDHWLGPDRAQAERLYHVTVAEWLSHGRAAPAPPPGEITLADVAERYLRHCACYYRGREQNMETINGILKPALELYGADTAASFTPRRLKTLRDHILENYDWVRKTINVRVAALVRMFKWAVSESLIPVEAWQALTAVEGLRKGFSPARESTRRVPLQQAELDAIRGYCPAPVWDALQVMLLTGCRPSELLGLRPCDIDRSGDVWTAVLEHHKTEHATGAPRRLFFGARAQAVLRPYLLRDAGACLFSPAESFQQSLEKRHAARVTPLSCGNVPGSNRVDNPKRQPGERYDKASFGRCVRRAIGRANKDRARDGLPPLRTFCVYEARHGAATAIRESFGLDAAAATLGHARISMTEHYSRLKDDMARLVAEKMG